MKNICSPLALLIASIAVIMLATSGRAAPNPERDVFLGRAGDGGMPDTAADASKLRLLH